MHWLVNQNRVILQSSLEGRDENWKTFGWKPRIDLSAWQLRVGRKEGEIYLPADWEGTAARMQLCLLQLELSKNLDDDGNLNGEPLLSLDPNKTTRLA